MSVDVDSVWFWLRWLNIFLYGGVLSGLIMNWRSLLNTPETPTSRVWLWSLVAVGMYSTIEVIFLKQPGGFRVVMMTLTLGGLFASLYVKPGQRIVRRFVRRPRTLEEENRAEGSR